MESIIALVLLAIASAAIVSLSGTIFAGQAGSKDLEVGTQLMQECAEQVLATRRLGGGYAAVNANTCSALGNLGGFGAPSVTITSNTTAACPTSATCETVAISVQKTGANLTPITLMLVSY
jgi:hypothetical protein